MSSSYSAIFGEDLTITKSQRTKLRILEAAAYCYATEDVTSVNFQHIADRAGITRPMIARYFGSLDNLFRMTVVMIRVEYQKLVVAEIEKATSPKGRVEAYIRSALSWPVVKPHHAYTWTVFLAQCTRKKELAELNHQFVSAGHERIQALLQHAGVHGAKAPGLAQALQHVITGALFAIGTENLSKSDVTELQDSTVDFLTRLLK